MFVVVREAMVLVVLKMPTAGLKMGKVRVAP